MKANYILAEWDYSSMDFLGHLLTYKYCNSMYFEGTTYSESNLGYELELLNFGCNSE